MVDFIEHNVLGKPLVTCSAEPLTGFFRDGSCRTGPDDRGSHTVCSEMTADFLKFTKDVGNDLSTPRPEYNFPGLKPGDFWCLCATRWHQAYQAGMAPNVKLEATHEQALKAVPLEALKEHAIDG